MQNRVCSCLCPYRVDRPDRMGRYFLNSWLKQHVLLWLGYFGIEVVSRLHQSRSHQSRFVSVACYILLFFFRNSHTCPCSWFDNNNRKTLGDLWPTCKLMFLPFIMQSSQELYTVSVESVPQYANGESKRSGCCKSGRVGKDLLCGVLIALAIICAAVAIFLVVFYVVNGRLYPRLLGT